MNTTYCIVPLTPAQREQITQSRLDNASDSLVVPSYIQSLSDEASGDSQLKLTPVTFGELEAIAAQKEPHANRTLIPGEEVLKTFAESIQAAPDGRQVSSAFEVLIKRFEKESPK